MGKKPKIRVNQYIRASQVRLIDEKSDMVGIKSLADAQRLADDRGYDLIEISPNANPPVCRLGNYSKYLYERNKKEKESRKNKGGGSLKEIRMRMKIGEHDFNTKLNAIVRFLKESHKVRVSFVFYGREMEHRDFGHKMIEKIEQGISGVGIIEQRPQMYGNRMVSILVPHKG